MASGDVETQLIEEPPVRGALGGERAMERPRADLEASGQALHRRAPGLQFFGQGGVVKKVVREVLTGSYKFDATDTYIRTIIWTPRQVIYLNPIIRWDGNASSSEGLKEIYRMIMGGFLGPRPIH